MLGVAMKKIVLRSACDVVGGQSALARLLGVKPPTVNEWINGKRPVPAERCPSIERATQGLVRCEDLRPDVDWAYLRATDCQVKVSPGETPPEEHREAA